MSVGSVALLCGTLIQDTVPTELLRPQHILGEFSALLFGAWKAISFTFAIPEVEIDNKLGAF